MSLIDIILKQELQNLLAATSDCDDVSIVPLGNVAFFRENVWKQHFEYIEASTKRLSHPGLSISSRRRQIALGTSKTENRQYFNTLFISPDDCNLVSKNTVFLLTMSVPADIFNLDRRKFDSYASISERKIIELKKKLKSGSFNDK